MGGTASRSAFSSMTEEQPLTPTPPRHEIRDVSGQRHFGLPVSWTPLNGSVQPAVQSSSSSSQELHEVFEGTIGGADGELEKPMIEPEADKSATNETGIDQLDATNDPEPYLHEYTPISAKLKTENRTSASNDGTTRSKNKLTSLLRTLSASAASSTARMTPKSAAAGDCRLMVDVQEKADVIVEEENPLSEKTSQEKDDPPSRSSVRKIFSLSSRRSSGTPTGSSAGRASLKYSPISDE